MKNGKHTVINVLAVALLVAAPVFAGNEQIVKQREEQLRQLEQQVRTEAVKDKVLPADGIIHMKAVVRRPAQLSEKAVPPVVESVNIDIMPVPAADAPGCRSACGAKVKNCQDVSKAGVIYEPVSVPVPVKKEEKRP